MGRHEGSESDARQCWSEVQAGCPIETSGLPPPGSANCATTRDAAPEEARHTPRPVLSNRCDFYTETAEATRSCQNWTRSAALLRASTSPRRSANACVRSYPRLDDFGAWMRHVMAASRPTCYPVRRAALGLRFAGRSTTNFLYRPLPGGMSTVETDVAAPGESVCAAIGLPASCQLIPATRRGAGGQLHVCGSNSSCRTGQRHS